MVSAFRENYPARIWHETVGRIPSGVKPMVKKDGRFHGDALSMPLLWLCAFPARILESRFVPFLSFVRQKDPRRPF